MKSTLKILRDNVFTIIVIFVFIIGMFALSYLKKIYFDDGAGYGARTEGVENNKITDSEVDEIKAKIKDNSNVVDVKYELKVRTINLTITVLDTVKVSEAKTMGKEILAHFEEDDLSYYSVNFNFKKEDKSLNDFPISGYKHYSNSNISWTKDREVTTDEDE